MRLLTFEAADGSLHIGVETAGGIVDVPAAAEAFGVSGLPSSIEELIGSWTSVRDALAALIARVSEQPGSAARWLPTGSSYRWGPAVPHPGKIICVGLNYGKHAAESNMQVPTAPVLFSKFGNAIGAHNSVIPLPRDGDQFDYEAELAIVIGRRGYCIDAADAPDYVFGYCNANDFSCRDLQFRSGQWLLGKCFDGWCPVGPYLVTADEVADPNHLSVRCYVNGELRQDGNSSDMIFPCNELVAYASRYMTLEPGDLILTGTPAGVALGRQDKPWLKAGDEVVVEVQGLGRLRNVVGKRK